MSAPMADAATTLAECPDRRRAGMLARRRYRRSGAGGAHDRRAFHRHRPRRRHRARRSGRSRPDASPRSMTRLERRLGRRACPPDLRLSRFLRPDGCCCRRKRWSRAPTPKRWSMRCCLSCARSLQREGRCRILDLGTGTGAIALALAVAGPGGGRDRRRIFPKRRWRPPPRNAADAGLADRFTPLHSDWFSAICGKFHAIVSNPPYIPSEEIDGLQAEVQDSMIRAARLMADRTGSIHTGCIAKGAAAHLERWRAGCGRDRTHPAARRRAIVRQSRLPI